MRVFLRCSSVWPIHDRSLALSPPLLDHSCSAMTREHALRIRVCGSSRGSDSRPSERVGKFRAGSSGVPILSYCSRSRRFQDPETRFRLQAWPPWAGNLISGRLGNTFSASVQHKRGLFMAKESQPYIELKSRKTDKLYIHVKQILVKSRRQTIVEYRQFFSYASLGWEFLIPPFHAFTYWNVASSHREIELLFLVHTYICSRIGVTNGASLVSQINSHLSGPSSEPLDKEIERRKSSASEIAHQRETLGRRRLESSSTEYENVHISHYTLIRVLPPMDWWAYVHEHESRRKAFRSIFFMNTWLGHTLRSLKMDRIPPYLTSAVFQIHALCA